MTDDSTPHLPAVCCLLQTRRWQLETEQALAGLLLPPSLPHHQASPQDVPQLEDRDEEKEAGRGPQVCSGGRLPA